MNVDLSSCIAGSKRAWDDFVRASAPVIYAAVRRALQRRAGGGTGHGAAGADDIADRVQDVYLRLLRDECRLLRTFDPKRASLVTWLTLIARTAVHEHARRRTLRTLAIDSQAPVAAPAAPEHFHGSPIHPPDEALAGFPLSILSDQQREVIVMLFQEGLSVDQAAARLEVAAQTIRSAKHKALTRLREHLAQDPSEAVESPPNPRNRGYPKSKLATTQETDDVAR